MVLMAAGDTGHKVYVLYIPLQVWENCLVTYTSNLLFKLYPRVQNPSDLQGSLSLFVRPSKVATLNKFLFFSAFHYYWAYWGWVAKSGLLGLPRPDCEAGSWWQQMCTQTRSWFCKRTMVGCTSLLQSSCSARSWVPCPGDTGTQSC